VLVTETSFCEGSSGNLAKRRLFSQFSFTGEHQLTVLETGNQLWHINHPSLITDYNHLLEKLWLLIAHTLASINQYQIKVLSAMINWISDGGFAY